MRLFAAIVPPEPTRRALAGLAGGLPGARWTPEENFHLTLRFIGEVDGESAEAFAEALAGVSGERFLLSLTTLGAFGGARPRLVWAGPEDGAAVAALRGRVNAALARAGLAPESRKFAPHVTLARMKAARPNAVADWLQSRAGFRAPDFAVEGFSLMSSRLGGAQPVYREEVRYPFGGEAFQP